MLAAQMALNFSAVSWAESFVEAAIGCIADYADSDVEAAATAQVAAAPLSASSAVVGSVAGGGKTAQERAVERYVLFYVPSLLSTISWLPPHPDRSPIYFVKMLVDALRQLPLQPSQLSWVGHVIATVSCCVQAVSMTRAVTPGVLELAESMGSVFVGDYVAASEVCAFVSEILVFFYDRAKTVLREVKKKKQGSDGSTAEGAGGDDDDDDEFDNDLFNLPTTAEIRALRKIGRAGSKAAADQTALRRRADTVAAVLRVVYVLLGLGVPTRGGFSVIRRFMSLVRRSGVVGEEGTGGHPLYVMLEAVARCVEDGRTIARVTSGKCTEDGVTIPRSGVPVLSAMRSNPGGMLRVPATQHDIVSGADAHDLFKALRRVLVDEPEAAKAAKVAA